MLVHVNSFTEERHPVRRVSKSPWSRLDTEAWPATIPAISQLLSDGMTLPKTTVFVGDNGSGKSTILEAVAMAFGIK